MKSIILTIALLVLTLMSCSTDVGFPIVENGQGGGNGDGIIASWVYVRYELYDIGETEPYEVVDIPCGFIYTVTPKEEEGRFRAESLIVVVDLTEQELGLELERSTQEHTQMRTTQTLRLRLMGTI